MSTSYALTAHCYYHALVIVLKYGETQIGAIPCCARNASNTRIEKSIVYSLTLEKTSISPSSITILVHSCLTCPPAWTKGTGHRMDLHQSSCSGLVLEMLATSPLRSDTSPASVPVVVCKIILPLGISGNYMVCVMYLLCGHFNTISKRQ